MRLGVISDIHGVALALQAVLDDGDHVGVDLVRRYGLMAAGAAWTRGVLDQAGVLGLLDGLPERQQMDRGRDGTARRPRIACR